MLTIKKVAEILSVTERTVYFWAKEGEIPAYKVGNSWRFREDEIREWLESRHNVKTPQAEATVGDDSQKKEVEDWNVRVRNCSDRVFDFLRKSDEKVWIVENIAEALDEDTILVRAAAKRLVSYERCETKEMFIGGKTRDILMIKKGR